MTTDEQLYLVCSDACRMAPKGGPCHCKCGGRYHGMDSILIYSGEGMSKKARIKQQIKSGERTPEFTPNEQIHTFNPEFPGGIIGRKAPNDEIETYWDYWDKKEGLNLSMPKIIAFRQTPEEYRKKAIDLEKHYHFSESPWFKQVQEAEYGEGALKKLDIVDGVPLKSRGRNYYSPADKTFTAHVDEQGSKGEALLHEMGHIYDMQAVVAGKRKQYRVQRMGGDFILNNDGGH